MKPVTSSVSHTCAFSSVEATLHAWLDPIPRGFVGSAALPPGVEPPAPQPVGPETHALNVELTLINTSEAPQIAQVIGWRWQQSDQFHDMSWGTQPDLSPLNQSNQIQRQLVQLSDNEAVTVKMTLEINGDYCHLLVLAAASP